MVACNKILAYSPGFKFLHWFIAIIIILMLCGSFFLEDVPKSLQSNAYMIHKSIGLSILFLMVVRFVWITYKGKPPLPETVPLWERKFARIIQYCLYFVLLIMPISGWIMSAAANRIPVFFGLVTLPFPGVFANESLAHFMNQAHKTLAWVLMVLVVLHIVGALKHYFIDRDKVLQLMLSSKVRRISKRLQ